MFGEEELNGKAATPPLCDATLRIERSGPDEMHWSIVDLPGLVKRGGSWKEEIAGTDEVAPATKSAIAESIVRRHLSNERNIVL